MQNSQRPPIIPESFGNTISGTLMTFPIPDTVSAGSGAASWAAAWQAINEMPEGSGGIPPLIQDFNGLMRQISAWAQWKSFMHVDFWDSDVNSLVSGPGYRAGAIVQSGTTAGLLWRSNVDNNTTDPDTGGAGWSVLCATVAPIVVIGTEGHTLVAGQTLTLTGTITCPGPGVILARGAHNTANSTGLIGGVLSTSAGGQASSDQITATQYHEISNTVTAAGAYVITYLTIGEGSLSGTATVTQKLAAEYFP